MPPFPLLPMPMPCSLFLHPLGSLPSFRVKIVKDIIMIFCKIPCPELQFETAVFWSAYSV